MELEALKDLTRHVEVNGQRYPSYNLPCPFCEGRLRLKWSAKFERLFYGCSMWAKTGCRGSVSSHPDGTPLGIPADDPTKTARIRAHEAFDRLWKFGGFTRKEAYLWLCQKMGLSGKDGHIGMFSLERCETLINLVQEYTVKSEIISFRGPYRWLSNFHMAPVTFEGLVYPSTEHAYQAAKSLDPEVREIVRLCETPKEAKRFGGELFLREDWNTVRLEIMRGLVDQKFRKHADLSELLLSTGDAVLIEGNTWHDNFYGVCPPPGGAPCLKCATKVGENNLGKILMDVRKALREETVVP